MDEFAIEWTKNGTYAAVTVPTGTALKNKLMKYSTERPDEVKLIKENKDGSAFFHIPINYVKVSPPRKVSDEQKKVARERLKRVWEEKKEKGNKVVQ